MEYAYVHILCIHTTYLQKANNLWTDIEVVQGTESIYTSCKVMTIPFKSKGNKMNAIVSNPLDEIQIDTVPNPEPVRISPESRLNYFLIFCDRCSRILI